MARKSRSSAPRKTAVAGTISVAPELEGIDDIISQISKITLHPDTVARLVGEFTGSNKCSWLPNEFISLTGTNSSSDVIYNSAFIRGAARQGFVFFLGADRRIYRHSVKLDVSLPSPKPLDNLEKVEDYFVKPVWYEDLKRFVDEGTTVLLIGPPGTGKTEACEQIFEERRQQLHIISCNQSMTADDLEGRVELRNDDGVPITQFEPASLAVAAMEGHGVLLDEADAIPAQAAFGLFRLLAGKDMRILRMGEDGIIPRHNQFRIIGTQNTEGRGDDKGLHHGRAYQDEAFLDRWENVIRVDYPIKSVEVSILAKRTGVEQKTAERIVDAAQLLRRALISNEIMFCCSMRRTLAVAANFTRGYTAERAWSYAVINRATREDVRNITEILNRVFGSDFK